MKTIQMTAKDFFNKKTRTFQIPVKNVQVQLSPEELRTLAGILMGCSKSTRKALAAAENGKLGGRFKNDDPRVGGIIAPATASRYVAKGKAKYGEYVEGKNLPRVYTSIYGRKDLKDLTENPLFDPDTTYRMVVRKDIEGRVDFYDVQYYRKRKEAE